MKQMMMASALCLAASAAMAAGPTVTYIEPKVVRTEAASSGGDDWVVLLMVALTFGTALLQ